MDAHVGEARYCKKKKDLQGGQCLSLSLSISLFLYTGLSRMDFVNHFNVDITSMALPRGHAASTKALP